MTFKKGIYINGITEFHFKVGAGLKSITVILKLYTLLLI